MSWDSGRLRAARKAAGITQKEVADICGVAESTVRHWEAGRQSPKGQTELDRTLMFIETAERDPMAAKQLPRVRFNPGQVMSGAEIRELRERLGLTAAEMAHRLGVSETTMSRWETGKNAPSPTAMQALAALEQTAPEAASVV